MSTTYRPAKLTTEEMHEVKHLMSAFLTLLSLWSLLSLEVQSGFLVVAAMSVVVCSLFFPGFTSRIPALCWKLAQPVLILAIGADFLLHLPEFIPSLVRMVMLLLIYRILAPRGQREDLQVILLCLFCLIMSGVMTVSLLFALQILLFTPLAMALLFVISLLDRGKQTEDYEITWEHFKWRRLVRRVLKVLDWRVLSLGTLMFAFVVMISTLLFMLTPRFNLDQAIPFLQVQTEPMTGFNNEVKLGQVTSLHQDNSVAIRIDLPSLDAIDTQPYWRMLVLDRYADGRFHVSDSLNSYQFREPITLRQIRSDSVPYGQRQGDLWTFYMEGGVSSYLPVPGDYSVLRFQLPQEIEILREPRIYSLDSVGQSVFSYQIEDMQFNTRFPTGRREWQGLEGAGPTGELELPKYPLTTLELALTEEERASLTQVNAGIKTNASLSAAEYSKNLTEYLWKNFEYSLKPDAQVLSEAGPDPVVNWLTKGSRGHCELFASTFVLLAREAGYPARLVVGFSGGSWNPVEDYFLLRNRDAHAWVEIFDRDARDWLRVDPTPGSGSSDPEELIAGSMSFESGWGAWVDSLRIQWYRRIVNFEQKDQIEMAMSLKEIVKEFTEEFSARAKAVIAEFKAWIAQPFSAGNMIRGLVVIFFVLSLYFIWRARYAILGLLFRLLRRPKALDPIRRQASRYLRRIREAHGQDVKLPIIFELQALRFGPKVSANEAKPVLAKARKVMRKKPPERLSV